MARSENPDYHQAGDGALGRLARANAQPIRPSDFAARIGGDEFAVLLPDISP